MNPNTKQQNNQLASFARDLHDMGANIVPIKRGTKAPNLKEGGLSALYDHTQTLEEVNALNWQRAAAVAVVSGPDSWRVFDLDAIKVKDENGKEIIVTPADEQVLADLLLALGLPSDYQWSYQSGSGAGWGLVFRCDDELGLTAKPQNKYIGLPSPGYSFGQLELRWARHYTIIDGAHPTGPGYRWRRGERPFVPPAFVSPQQVEAAFKKIAILKDDDKPERSNGHHTTPPAPDTDGRKWALKALRENADQLASTPQGGRNQALNDLTFRLAKIVNGGNLTRQEVEETMTGAALRAGLGEDETAATIKSAFDGAGGEEAHPAPKSPPKAPKTTKAAPKGGNVTHTPLTDDSTASQPLHRPGDSVNVVISGQLQTATPATVKEVLGYAHGSWGYRVTLPGGVEKVYQEGNLQPVTRPTSFDPLPLKDLLARQFPPQEFLVEGVFAKGHLVILGGRPKGGKSWLALQLAQCIDTGAPFLGKKTNKARVLLYALEDGERRIQERAKAINWKPDNAAVMFAIANLDDGHGGPGPGIAEIEGLTKGYDLIIVDTLITAMSGRTDERDNSAMGSLINALAAVAHKTDTSIIVIHHTGKAYNPDDIFSTLRGASAIRGGYDVGLILERKPGEREAILHAESRDLDIANMTLRQAENGAGWDYMGDSRELEKIRAGRKVLEVMQDHDDGDGMTAKQIAALRGTGENTVYKQLTKLEEGGYVVKDEQPATQMGKKPDIWRVKAGIL